MPILEGEGPGNGQVGGPAIPGEALAIQEVGDHGVHEVPATQEGVHGTPADPEPIQEEVHGILGLRGHLHEDPA